MPEATRRAPRLAAGRARALGAPTRGTTNPNRLRRMDRFTVSILADRLRAAADPLVIDLGYGASPVTTVELSARLASIRPDVRVLGLELDGDRVRDARTFAAPPALDFARGGFELAGHQPIIIRAANVLRQYDEAATLRAWTVMCAGLAEGGALVEGTCDEIGRLGCWALLEADGPVSLTLSARLLTLARPSQLAQRLPKALIHHNVPGQPIHRLLLDLDRAWDSAAPMAAFGPRQRWAETCSRVATAWPVLGGRARWRLGELTVEWAAVAPV